ncbi:A/G-specific adenine glycosylase [Flavobacterium sp. H122]|uniref:A/G-specific adenine glycosylase n=1 Tax=Flavobacterium sp. H122 TaxID=2529860 RepID=UPI0010AAFE79|nr:A/G-specific adenine glycosylase [Flavobacterium sp. H122]
MNFSNLLISWYLENKRDLPWRNTTDPYHIWLSEIMLQQTRVAQGLPYFFAFTGSFSTVHDLAKADEEKVLKLWQGLGYYSRARNLHGTAKYISEVLNGEFPDNYKDLLKLKGVGEYTAAAIASFSFNECVPVVDGNVYRVLSRYFAIETDIASGGAKKEFTALASELIDKERPALFNQAIMEFGALQCVPKNPNCKDCPLNNSCLALAKNKVNELPVKLKKTKISNRHLNYILVVDQNNNSIINKRTQKGIWHNLYEFPVIETENKSDLKEIESKIEEMFPKASSVKLIEHEETIHKLSHQHLHINFWKATVNTVLEKGISHQELLILPVPIVLHNFIERNPY